MADPLWVFFVFATVELPPDSENFSPGTGVPCWRTVAWPYDWACSFGWLPFEGQDGSAMATRRHELTDEQWNAIKDFLPGRKGTPGVTAKNNRVFLNAVFWIARTGAPWRDLPDRYGPWNSVFRRFSRWCQRGVFQRIMSALQDPDLTALFLDSTIVRAHQHAAGAEGSTPDAEALGRSRGGFSTKIHVACDGLGKPVRIILTPGQDHDITQASELIAGSKAKAVIADKGYDSDDLIKKIKEQKASPVIPPRKGRTEPREYDAAEYEKRNIIERFINVLKQCRRIATRYEKTARNFLGMISFAAVLVLIN